MSLKQKTFKKNPAIRPQKKISRNSLRRLLGDGLTNGELTNNDVQKKIIIKSALDAFLLES